MRICIAMLTLISVVVLTTAEAQVPKKAEIPKYIGQLKNSRNARERAEAAAAIGRRGAIIVTDVKDAIEPLVYAVKSDSDAQCTAPRPKALGEIGSEPNLTVPAWPGLCKTIPWPSRWRPSTPLAEIGPEARSALPSLRTIAQAKKDKKLSKAAGMAMKAIGGKKKK